jgi:hypothetical protein
MTHWSHPQLALHGVMERNSGRLKAGLLSRTRRNSKPQSTSTFVSCSGNQAEHPLPHVKRLLSSSPSQVCASPLVQVELGHAVEGAALLAEALLRAAHYDAGVAGVRLAHLVAPVVVLLLCKVTAAALHLRRAAEAVKITGQPSIVQAWCETTNGGRSAACSLPKPSSPTARLAGTIWHDVASFRRPKAVKQSRRRPTLQRMRACPWPLRPPDMAGCGPAASWWGSQVQHGWGPGRQAVITT